MLAAGAGRCCRNISTQYKRSALVNESRNIILGATHKKREEQEERRRQLDAIEHFRQPACREREEVLKQNLARNERTSVDLIPAISPHLIRGGPDQRTCSMVGRHDCDSTERL